MTSECTPQSRPLITYCFNNGEIFEMDMWNVQLMNRITDVLSQRTNQIQPDPELTAHPMCLNRIQNGQNLLNAPCEGVGLVGFPIQPNDNLSLRSIYNPHYRLDWSRHDETNLKDTPLENQLVFPLENPARRDWPTAEETAELNEGLAQSQKELYRTFHSHEINSEVYLNHNQKLFDNTTKEFYKSNQSDTRNDGVLYKSVVKPALCPCPNRF